jgi:hypothetical protein
MVTHTCNPSYSGGRDQEDHGSKPALNPISKKPITKMELVEWLKVKAPSSSPQPPTPHKKKTPEDVSLRP